MATYLNGEPGITVSLVGLRSYHDGEFIYARHYKCPVCQIRYSIHPRSSCNHFVVSVFSDGGCVSDDKVPRRRKEYLPRTGAKCPRKAKLVDEILRRANRGESIISPRPAPDPLVARIVYKYRGKSIRRATDAELKNEEL